MTICQNLSCRKTRKQTAITSSHIPEDILFVVTGHCGRWIIYALAVCYFMTFLHAMNLFADEMYVPYTTNYYCKGTTPEEKGSCYYKNGTKCHDFEFPSHLWESAVEKWVVVCDDEFYAIALKVAFKVGLALGYFLGGILADRYGRKCVMFYSLGIQALIGILQGTCRTLFLFLIIHCIYGLCISMSGLTIAILACEYCRNKWRSLSLGILAMAYPLAVLILPYVWITLSKRSHAGTLLSIPQLAIYALSWLIQESPVWLLTKNMVNEAEHVTFKIAKLNGIELNSFFKIRPVFAIHTSRTLGITELLLWHGTRQLLFNLAVVWFILGLQCGTVFSPFWSEIDSFVTTTAVIAGCCFASIFLSLLVYHFLDHKYVMLIIIPWSTILGIFTLRHLYIVPEAYRSNTRLAALTLYAAVISVLYNVTPRVFPTTLRCTTTGICFSFYQLGMMASNLLLHHLERSSTTINALFISTAILAFILICFIPSVHGRELPDTVADMAHFKRRSKPVRWTTLRQTSTTLDEVEVDVIEYDRSIKSNFSYLT